MTSVVFCHAASDGPLAREIGDFLELNLPLTAFYDEGLLHPGFDLIDAAARGLSAEIAIVILSPEAVPKKWERSRWEPVLLEQPRETGAFPIFVLARESKFPELLKRQAFADLRSDRLQGLREIKRLVLKRHPAVRNTFDLPALSGEVSNQVLEPLRIAVVDRPAVIFDVPRDTALHLAHASIADFEGAFWIDCSGRTQAGILGDTGNSLAIPLSGSLEQNGAALREFSKGRRCLFLYEHLPPENRSLVDFAGRSSGITIGPSPSRARLSGPDIKKLFSQWPNRLLECLAHLGDAYHCLLAGAVDVGPALLALLKNQERLAEADEVLEVLIADAQARHDDDALASYNWDRSWIWGHWGEPYSATLIPSDAVRSASQLGFDFS